MDIIHARKMIVTQRLSDISCLFTDTGFEIVLGVERIKSLVEIFFTVCFGRDIPEGFFFTKQSKTLAEGTSKNSLTRGYERPPH